MARSSGVRLQGNDGACVGDALGLKLGDFDGLAVGNADGDAVGDSLGLKLGGENGGSVSSSISVGDVVGALVVLEFFVVLVFFPALANLDSN